MRAHGLGGGGERLDGLHHGLGGHDWCPWVVEGDREGHLHDSMGDGDNGPSVVHNSRHLCRGRCNVHVQAILLGAGTRREGERERGREGEREKRRGRKGVSTTEECDIRRLLRPTAVGIPAISVGMHCVGSPYCASYVLLSGRSVGVVARLLRGKQAQGSFPRTPHRKTPSLSLSLFLTLNVSSSEESPL